MDLAAFQDWARVAAVDQDLAEVGLAAAMAALAEAVTVQRVPAAAKAAQERRTCGMRGPAAGLGAVDSAQDWAAVWESAGDREPAAEPDRVQVQVELPEAVLALAVPEEAEVLVVAREAAPAVLELAVALVQADLAEVSVAAPVAERALVVLAAVVYRVQAQGRALVAARGLPGGG